MKTHTTLSPVDILKGQADALGAYLILQDGLALRYSACLEAIAAMHGHRAWNEVATIGRDTARQEEIEVLSQDPTDIQHARLREHFLKRYGLPLAEDRDAVAAIRWGGLVVQLGKAVGDPVAVARFLNTPHPQLGGRDPRELLETDAGYEQVDRFLLTLMPSAC